jgi:crotonobetainyl-CoA:carnitine CoA-transferase CaiB-like acyl-CoA transferase
MGCCGYDDQDVPDAPPIAPGGGNAWHTGGHFAYIAIMGALVYRTATGKGQYIDASIHEACALTTEPAIPVYIYTGQVVRRQTGRHAFATPMPRTQLLCKDGLYVNGGGINRLPPERLRVISKWMDTYGLADDLMDEKYLDPKVTQENASHINQVVTNFVANLTREEAYHGFQERGFPWGAVRTPDELVEDGHLNDREFWAKVEHPELKRSFTYPGPAAIYHGTPWRLSRRAPLVGEHNEEVLCGELGLSRAELAVLAEGGVV